MREHMGDVKGDVGGVVCFRRLTPYLRV